MILHIIAMFVALFHGGAAAASAPSHVVNTFNGGQVARTADSPDGGMKAADSPDGGMKTASDSPDGGMKAASDSPDGGMSLGKLGS